MWTAAALAVLGCDEPLHACTLIGCVDAVVVELLGVPAQTVMTVEVDAPGATPQMRTCSTSDGRCAVTFESFAPETLTVLVSGGAESVAFTVQPAYVISRPNGRDCPPECRSTQLTVQL